MVLYITPPNFRLIAKLLKKNRNIIQDGQVDGQMDGRNDWQQQGNARVMRYIDNPNEYLRSVWSITLAVCVEMCDKCSVSQRSSKKLNSVKYDIFYPEMRRLWSIIQRL